MFYDKVVIESFGYEIPEIILTSREIQHRLNRLLSKKAFKEEKFEEVTGIRERRLWPMDFNLDDAAVKASEKALASADTKPKEIGMVIYAGVYKTLLEPATACGIASKLGIPENAQVYDISNACLGVMNGIVQVANAIELNQINAGLVVTCESSREIIESMFRYLEINNAMETIQKSFATFTLGSAAIAVVLKNEKHSIQGHKLVSSEIGNAVRYHELCWIKQRCQTENFNDPIMQTDSVALFKLGEEPVLKVYLDFKKKMNWDENKPDKIIFHQIGKINHTYFHRATKIPLERGFETFSYLGNTASVALPITAAIAEERNFLRKGDQVCFAGMGSGINAIMLGLDW